MKFLLSLITSLLFFCLTIEAQQSDSPLTLGKDQLYEKSGGRGISLYNAQMINTEHLDFSPAWYHGSLVFISSRKKGGYTDENIGEKFFQMYVSRLDPFGVPVKAESFSMELSSRFHEGPLCFTTKGDRIYFTSNNQKKGVKRADGSGRVSLKIYTAERGATGWMNIQSLPFNMDEYSTMHPTISPDGNTLYFASDRPGGFGGNDIWMVEKNGENWGNPVNLGPNINTEGNDAFPFLHYSGYLFYASDGQEEGLGGLDIYSVNTANMPDASAQILSAPFNSPDDDFGLILDDSGTKGYFSSDRPGGTGKDDIYGFESEWSLAGEMSEHIVHIAVQVQDAKTKHALPQSSVFVIEKDPFGGAAGELLYDMEVIKKPQEEGGQLILSMVRKKNLDLTDPEAMTDDAGFALRELKPGREYLILVDKPGYKLRELNYVTPEKPGVYDLPVALDSRACFTLTGIVKNQKSGDPVGKATVTIEGDDKSNPLKLTSDAQGRFEACLPDATTYSLLVEKEGYILGRNRVSTFDGDYAKERKVDLLLLPFSNTPEEKSPEPLSKGSVIVMENLYYDYNKITLRPGSVSELDLVYDLMRSYPEMEIELGAHTDCRGSSQYNQRLSDARAESTKNYLISRGIQPARIKAKGYGESQIRNQCKDGVDCAESEHEHNRRTEILITRLDQPVQVIYGD